MDLPSLAKLVGVWLINAIPVTVIIGAIAFLLREKIKAYLLADVERLKAGFQHDLEAKKATWQQELEAYKTSLIAQAERAKAESELKKTIALRCATLEFERIIALEQASAEEPTYILARLCLEPDAKRQGNIAECTESLRRMNAAVNGAQMFVPSDIRKRARQMLGHLAALNVSHSGPGTPMLLEGDTYNEILRISADIDHWAQERIKELSAV